MTWWGMKKTIRSSSSCSSSMSLLCALWLLVVCLAPGSRGQRLRETEGVQSAARAHLGERDALCHPEGCYTVYFHKKTFREAGRSCREQGGTLATMHTHEAAGVVHELLSDIEAQGTKMRLRLWIGLHRPPRQCSSKRPLRGFIWVTGDQDGQFTNWVREETPGTCTVPRCVALTVHTLKTGRDSRENFRWLDGSCALPLDGYVCQYTYKGMCSPLQDEGSGPAVYTTPFQLVSTLLTHVPYGSIAALHCPADSSDPDAPSEETVLCMDRDDGTVGWSRDVPICSSSDAPKNQDWCSRDHGCEQYCNNTDTDYYCYCAEGFILDEDGYSCRLEFFSQTDFPQLSSDSAGPTDKPHIKKACVDNGCEYNCVETPRGIRCTCPPGYLIGPDGHRCSDVDECLQQPCPQLCVNIPGTFHCTCHSGYQPDDEGECMDIDECLDESSCEGICENTEGSFTCLCHSGYAFGSGGQCVDVDECVGASPCQQQCINFMGGYQCYCDSGFDLQADGLTCRPSPDDEEYSTLTPDPSDATHVLFLGPNLDIPWSSLFTPDPNFEADVNWPAEATEPLSADTTHGSDNHLNQWDAVSPKQYQTAPSPTQKYRTDNEIEGEAKMGGREASGGVGAETAKDSMGGTGEWVRSNVDNKEDANATEAEYESADGKRKHDKSWLLVALLVPLCVFLVVMLALGIVYCTSCAVDKSLSFSDCYRWILPASPPDRRDGKTHA